MHMPETERPMLQSIVPVGHLNHVSRQYGVSVQGIPLRVFGPERAAVLIMAAIHGDESLGSTLLSECLRTLEPTQLRTAVILAANPDGVLAGTRCNARGVDLNRNYPADNWSPDPVYYRNGPGEPQNIALSPGSAPASEPETRALMELVTTLNPRLIVSIHGFLGCLDDPEAGPVTRDMARRTQLELVPDVGYATPGSFGSWCAEKNMAIITYELPAQGLPDLRKSHLPIFCDLLTGKYDALLEGR